MAEEHFTSRFRLPWMRGQRVAPRETAPAPFEWRQTMRSRVLICASVFALWTVGIEARLLYLQIVAHADLSARANRQQIRTVKPAAKRGEILDRNGRYFAFSVNSETIGADPSQVVDPVKTARELCHALDDCSGERLADLIAQLSRKTRFVYIERKASVDTATRVAALKLPGIVMYPESRRYYPKRELAAHLIGYVGLDNDGLAGVESAFDSRVRGKEGRLILEIDSRQAARAAREERPATAGDSLELTIDQYLQHIAERELRAGVEEHNAAGGTAIIMDPHSGEILALANYPTFNPNSFQQASDMARKNRAIQDTYEPGSTFKLVTASAALEEGVLQTTDLIDCAPGYITIQGRKPIRDVHTYGVLTFEDVIVKSSNVGAIKAGLRIGPERLSRYINRFGFGQAIAPDFKGESGGIVWSSDALGASGLASVSMGYQIGVTPLQMASAVSSVANGGTLYEPHLVRAFIRNGRRDPVAPKALRRTIKPETAATMTGIMEAVVERGTAKLAKIEGYTVAGKTGTAAKVMSGGGYSDRDYNTSFVGFVPSRKPAMTIIVVIDSPHGKVTAYGGTVAAPIFQRIAEASLRHLGIGPSINAPSPILVTRKGIDLDSPLPRTVGTTVSERLMPAVSVGLMPDLRGLSARAAMKSLTSAGLTVKLSGDGVVAEQFPEAGAPLIPGDVAKLKLVRHAPETLGGGFQQ